MECLLFFIEWLTRHIYIICFPFFLFESPIVSFIRNWLSTGGKQRQHKGTSIMSNNSTLPSLGELLQEAKSLMEFVSIIQLVNYTDCGCLALQNCSRREMSADWELFRKMKCRPRLYTFITMVSFVSKLHRANNNIVSIRYYSRKRLFSDVGMFDP